MVALQAAAKQFSAGRHPAFGGSSISSSERRAAAGRRFLVVRAAGPSGGERQPWDFGRFVRTVLYFNKPPTPQELLGSLFKGLPGQGQAAASATTTASGSSTIPPGVQTLIAGAPGSSGMAAGSDGSNDVILVTGATGGVGRRVVARLLAAGRRVRALVRDVPRAQELLSGLPAGSGGRLELAAADLTQAATLQPAYFLGVRAVVCCHAVKVAPKEGDTADRSKYYQGIKFYDPEIQGDTPESVELNGMRNLLAAVGGQLAGQGGQLLFSPDGRGAVQDWGSLDDVVMGGISESGFVVRQGVGEDGGPCGVFAGSVTTANNGGFASVRTRNLDPPLDLSGYEGIELRVKGDGKRYKLIIRDGAGWDTVGYTKSFDTQPGWQTVRLQFSDFKPVFRARTMLGMPPLNTANICSFQLMLSKFEADGMLNPTFQTGAFQLPVQRISAYAAAAAVPRIVLVSSAGVTRPNRPGIEVEKEPPAVRMNEELGGILTYKLAAEDALRASGVPFSIVRPVALTEEPRGMPLVFDQGDTLKGKVSREDIADLCVALLGLPAAAGTTFEVGSTVPFSQPWEGDATAPPRDWAALVQGAGLKKRVTGKTIRGRYLGKEPEPEPAPTGSAGKAGAAVL
ncbi:hypothetical protein ABPG75_005228 [Micractinium tetrahymenae]